MSEWQYLLPELLCAIYMYLPRRDRLTCSMVCQRWKDSLDCIFLWKIMSVRIDTDLMEPSTMHLTRYYYKYIKTLEFGWTSPQSRWLPYHHQELTKRAVRYLLVLDEYYVQLSCIKLSDWFDNFRFKKIVYHLCRFLRHQMNLSKIIFSNANLPKPDHIKLMESCLSSRETIKYLDIKCDYCNRTTFESLRFLNCMKLLKNLIVLKVDYLILNRGVFDAIIKSENTNLKVLEITVHEIYGWVITKEQWICLITMCPDLEIIFLIKNIYHYSEISFFLEKNVPLKRHSIYFTVNKVCLSNI